MIILSTTTPPTPTPSPPFGSRYYIFSDRAHLLSSPSPPFPHRKIILSQKQTCLSLRSRPQILTNTLTASVLITSKHPHLEPKSGELNLAGPKLFLVPFRLHKTLHRNPRTGSTRRNFRVRHLRLPVPLTSKHGCTGFSPPLRILLLPPFQ